METDRSIINRVLGGDIEAYAQLVKRHQGWCLRFAMRLLGDYDDAEDVVQDAFVRASHALAQCRNPDRFHAWIHQILVNRCRTAMERRATQDRWFVRLGNEDAIDSSEGDPARMADRDELRQALLRLPPLYREAVVLKYANELTYDEMAEITGVGVPALKMRVSRGLAILRKLLTQ